MSKTIYESTSDNDTRVTITKTSGGFQITFGDSLNWKAYKMNNYDFKTMIIGIVEGMLLE